MPRRLPKFVRRAACCLLMVSATGRVVGAESAVTEERYTWRNVEIKGGGFVTGLLFHPREQHLLYARTDVGGAYRWDEARAHWLPLNDALGRNAAELLGVLSLALDPQDANRVYLACGSYTATWAKPAAVLASADRGESWRRIDLPFKLGGNEDGRSTGERLQVDPRNGAVLLLGTSHDGLWRSDDRASTWRRVEAFLAKRVTFVLFASAPERGAEEIFVGAADPDTPGLYCSRDGAKTWIPLPGQPRGLIFHHAASDAHGVLYLAGANGLGPNGATAGAVWKFASEAAQWTDITPRRPDVARKDVFGYAGLAIEGPEARVLIVSTLDRWHDGDEVFRSTDAGATWKPMLAGGTWNYSRAPYTATLKPHWIGNVALDPFDAERLWFVTGYGVWATDHASAVERGAATPWTFLDDGLEETVPLALVSPPTGAPLVSAIADIAGFRHGDLGRSPAAGMHQPSHTSNFGIAFAAAQPLKLIRTHSGPTHGALSIDGGVSWRDFATAPSTAGRGPGKIAISVDGRRLVWLPKDSVPFFSGDDGVTWHESRGGPVSAKDFTSDWPVADGVISEVFYIYEHATGRVFASSDAGASFRVSAELPRGGGMMNAPAGHAGEVWAPTPAGLFRSLDGAQHFAKISGLDAATDLGFGHAAPAHAEPAVFVDGWRNGERGLFRSDDNGVTWLMISDPQHQFGWIHAVSGDPRVFGRVYLATGGRGIVYGEPGKK